MLKVFICVNKVEQEAAMQALCPNLSPSMAQDLPESDETLVASVRKLQQYQQNELGAIKLCCKAPAETFPGRSLAADPLEDEVPAA